MSGLDDGPAVNARHGEIRRMIRHGDIDLPGLLLGDCGHDALEHEALRMMVGPMIRCLPSVTTGEQCVALLAGIHYRDRIGELTIRQRTALAHRIRQETR